MHLRHIGIELQGFKVSGPMALGEETKRGVVMMTMAMICEY